MKTTTDDPKLAARPEVRTIRALLRKRDKTLADYQAVGQQMHRLAADEAVTGRPGWRRAVAAALDDPALKSTLDKCLQLRTKYPTRADLKRLADIEDRWSFVLTALVVEGEKARHQLLRTAKHEGWSGADLQARVQLTKGSVRGGGRPKVQPKVTGLAPDLHRLLSLLEDLDVFLDAVWAHHAPRVAKLKAQAVEDEGINAKRLGAVLKQVTGLPEKVRKAVEQATRLDTVLNPPEPAAPKSR